ncbi:regucalcin-like isoform X2 [Acanthaster planci]|uniref:Regucalcin n=1 Tax=Acanthaster planci TaxID=133434 RepID=A0A8B7Y929_ACAPL|nr:regucalcin-like isoform X2 [Acanthaster planci]
MTSVSVVLERCGILLEGPHWDDDSQCLYFIDYINGAVHRWNPETQNHETRTIGDRVSSVVTTRTPGVLCITTKHRFVFLDWESGLVTHIAEIDQDRPENHLNDGKCDSMGRFWAGTVGPLETPTKVKPKQGSLFRLDGDGSVTKHVDGVDISNGMCWSHDYRTMYYIDSLSGRVDAFDYCLETGGLSNRRPAVEIPNQEGFPDGMTMDTEGMLWVACFDGSKVNRYNPQTGEKLQTVRFPCSYVTSCCFGGKNLDTLYVTTSNDGLGDQKLREEPLAGSLFKALHIRYNVCRDSTEV